MLLYGYGSVCICMLIFNLLYLFAENRRDRRIEKESRRFEEEMGWQIERIRDGKEPEDRYIRRLRKKLARANHLMAFERALSVLEAHEEGAALEIFQSSIRWVVLELAGYYVKRDDIEAAYFAWFVSRHRAAVCGDDMQEMMLEYVKKNNLYCRVNSMQALYVFGAPETIARAVTLMSRMGSSFNEKILTDGLLTYGGDRGQLIEQLLGCLDQLTGTFRLAVLNFVRFQSGGYCEKMYDILTDSGSDKEMRLSAIRYFGKYAYEPARKILLEFVTDKDPGAWEYAAVSATCLAAYSGSDVIAALMEAMHSSNWYVRFNASVSLESYDLDYVDLIEVAGGRDRYAREMMMYRLNAKRLKQNKLQKEAGME